MQSRRNSVEEHTAFSEIRGSDRASNDRSLNCKRLPVKYERALGSVTLNFSTEPRVRVGTELESARASPRGAQCEHKEHAKLEAVIGKRMSSVIFCRDNTWPGQVASSQREKERERERER